MGQSQLAIPGGKKKGTPLSQAETEDINYWLKRISGDLEQNPNKQFADKDRDWCAAARAELERRKGGGSKATAPTPQAQSIQRAQEQQSVALVGDNPASVNQWFISNADRFHLVSPSTAVQNLPEGCEVAISMIKLNPDPAAKDVYKTDGGLLAPTGTSLAKISQAAGISWDPNNCGPVGDRTDSRYVEYKAVGGWKLFDGTFIVEPAHRAVDLRDGSDEIANMTEKQIAQQRTKVLPLAETKAKNRVIRRLGLKPGYTAEELEKPFAVARLMWTGRTNDPALKQAFALMKAQQMIAGAAQLFGPAPEQTRHTIAHLMSPAQPSAFAQSFAPQPSATLPDPDDYDTSGSYVAGSDPAELGSGQSATSTPLPQAQGAATKPKVDYAAGEADL